MSSDGNGISERRKRDVMQQVESLSPELIRNDSPGGSLPESVVKSRRAKEAF
jgi:hypothetical protein